MAGAGAGALLLPTCRSITCEQYIPSLHGAAHSPPLHLTPVHICSPGHGQVPGQRLQRLPHAPGSQGVGHTSACHCHWGACHMCLARVGIAQRAVQGQACSLTRRGGVGSGYPITLNPNPASLTRRGCAATRCVLHLCPVAAPPASLTPGAAPGLPSAWPLAAVDCHPPLGCHPVRAHGRPALCSGRGNGVQAAADQHGQVGG